MNIVIVGGGTAGWLAALILSKNCPMHNITIIDSSKIDIIGAGEGSTGLLTSILNNDRCNYGCNINDFLKETGSTPKFGIKHINWTGDGSHYYGPLDGTPTTSNLPDFLLCYQNIFKTKNLSFLGYLLDNNLSNYNFLEHKLNTLSGSFHFDARKVGKYFKKVALTGDNILHLDSVVENIILDVNGNIKELYLDSGNALTGDFFIDATGFSKILSNKLTTDWVDYSDYLPVNSALPFLLPYEEDNYGNFYTVARALDNGWMWQIPTVERLGCGYVFDENFISADNAQREIEQILGKPIQPIKHIRFQSGRVKNSWNKNCLNVGLSSAFLEPLEATSIHATIVQLETFVFDFLKSTLELTNNDYSRKEYNKRINKMYDDFKDFLILHYQGGREDTEFWKHVKYDCKKTEKVHDIIEISKYRIPTVNDFDNYFGSAGWPIWSWVLMGTGNLPINTCRNEINRYHNGDKFTDVIESRISSWTSFLEENCNNNYTQKEYFEILKKNYFL